MDIAKHGSEAPVKQLREHGIDAAEIDRCVTRHKMDVLETPPEMDASEQGLKTALTLKSTCRPPSETRRAGDYGD